jgi:hypothetical protein
VCGEHENGGNADRRRERKEPIGDDHADERDADTDEQATVLRAEDAARRKGPVTAPRPRAAKRRPMPASPASKTSAPKTARSATMPVPTPNVVFERRKAATSRSRRAKPSAALTASAMDG